MLVMMPDRGPQVGELLDAGQDAVAQDRIGLDRGVLLVGQLFGLEEQALRHAGDADVVQEAGEVQIVEDRRRQLHVLADRHRHFGHAFAVAPRLRDVGVNGGGQALDQPGQRVGHAGGDFAVATLVDENASDQGHDAQVGYLERAPRTEVQGHDPVRLRLAHAHQGGAVRVKRRGRRAGRQYGTQQPAVKSRSTLDQLFGEGGAPAGRQVTFTGDLQGFAALAGIPEDGLRLDAVANRLEGELVAEALIAAVNIPREAFENFPGVLLRQLWPSCKAGSDPGIDVGVIRAHDINLFKLSFF